MEPNFLSYLRLHQGRSGLVEEVITSARSANQVSGTLRVVVVVVESSEPPDITSVACVQPWPVLPVLPTGDY